MPGILEAVLKQKDMCLKEALPSIIEANKPVIFSEKFNFNNMSDDDE